MLEPDNARTPLSHHLHAGAFPESHLAQPTGMRRQPRDLKDLSNLAGGQ
jgi:hypothetical protein